MPRPRRACKSSLGSASLGAEKILLFTRTHPVLALESNGLRALLRLGFGEEQKSYATTYRLVQQAIGGELGMEYPRLIEAHLLLRRHGQELCRRSDPLCEECPLALICAYRRERMSK
jgi:endonuclease III